MSTRRPFNGGAVSSAELNTISGIAPGFSSVIDISAKPKV
jgi:hypothetical protein